MNEHELEQLLKNLEPRKASPAFKDSLLRDISQAERERATKSAFRWRPVIIGVAATLLLCVTLWKQRERDHQTRELITASSTETKVDSRDHLDSAIFEPTAAKTILVSYTKEPLKSEDRVLDRHCYELVDCIEWTNRKNGNLVRVVRPRRETVILCSNTY